MRQFEIVTGRHQELHQADVVMAGDNPGASTGGQYALNARGTLFRRIAAA